MAERKAAASKRLAAAATCEASKGNGKADPKNHPVDEVPPRFLTCSACSERLNSTLFNRNQISKGDRGGKARCRSCVEKATTDEADGAKKATESRIRAARDRVAAARAGGNAVEMLRAESELSALEAEHVTGLKPVKLGKGRGRGGRWSSGGRGGLGRGRSGRGGV